MERTDNIMAGGGDPPRFDELLQPTVLQRLASASKCDHPNWYFLAYEDQTNDPAFKALLGAEASRVHFVRETLFAPNKEAGTVLSLLQPERVTEADWSVVKRFTAVNSLDSCALLIGQKIEESRKKASPIWRDNGFAQHGTYVIND
jgi:hypothetical protein